MLPRQDRREALLNFRRRVPWNVRQEVAREREFHCQMCGACPGDIDELTGKTARFRAQWIPNNGLSFRSKFPELRVLCSTCDDGASRITTNRPSAVWLLSQIRRAGILEQRAAYEWLRRKFGPNP